MASTEDMNDERAKRDADIDPEIVWSRTEEMVASSTLRAMAMKVKDARDARDVLATELRFVLGQLEQRRIVPPERRHHIRLLLSQATGDAS